MSSVNGVTNNQAYSTQQTYTQQTNNTSAQANVSQSTQQEQTAYTPQQDVVDITGANAVASDPTKQLYSPDKVTLKHLNAVAENNLNTLKQMVEKLLSSQGHSVSGNFSQSFEAWSSLREDDETMQSFGFKMEFSFEFDLSSTVDGATQDQAAELVSENGPLGVNQVADNILGFAKAISGGDTSKIDLLRDAFQKGFDEVAELFGGKDKLPEISNQTYEAVMKGFEDWQSGLA